MDEESSREVVCSTPFTQACIKPMNTKGLPEKVVRAARVVLPRQAPVKFSIQLNQ